MSLHHTTTVHFQHRSFAAASELSSFASKYPGRALFATRFSPEDQVVAHLIFQNKLPLRVFTYSGGDQHDILVRSVDFFQRSIEVSFQQARLATAAFAARHPEVVAQYEQNPAIAPLAQILQGHHLLISSRRKNELSSRTALEWDEKNQRAIFYPLFDWTEQQVQAYLAYYQIPQIAASPAPVPVAAPSVFSVWVNALQLRLNQRRTAVREKLDISPDAFPFSRPKQAFFGLSE